MMYNPFTGVQGYKIWESNGYDYGYPRQQPYQSNKLSKHKYQVNDMVLDVVEGKVGRIRGLLSWPDYFVGTSSESWISNEAHIEPLTNDEVNDVNKVTPTMNNLDDWEEEPAQYNPLSTRITDITDTGDITISKNGVDLANDGGESTISSIKRIDNDVEDLKSLSDINMQKTADIEVKTHDIEQRVCDIETRQKKISKISKLALLSRFL